MSVYIIASTKSWHDRLVINLQNQFVSDTFIRFKDSCDLIPERLNELDPKYIFFPHWSWIIPDTIFKSFPCVIFHMTDLPYGRGGSPLQNLIIRGHKNTMITALKCAEGIDAGPIYAKKPLRLHGSANEIFIRSSHIIEKMIADIITKNPEPIPQKGDIVSFKRRTPEQSEMQGEESVENVYNFIRMLDADEYPHANIHYDGFEYTFTKAIKLGDCVRAEVTIRKIQNG